MPTEYHLYTADEEPAEIADLIEAARPDRWALRIASESEDWTLCDWRTDWLLGDLHYAVGCPVGSPFRREVWERFDRRDLAAIRQSYECEEWGMCRIEFQWPYSLAVDMTEADIRLIRDRDGDEVLNGLFLSKGRYVLSIPETANRQSYDLLPAVASALGRVTGGVVCNVRSGDRVATRGWWHLG
jgi:hypothetical protein